MGAKQGLYRIVQMPDRDPDLAYDCPGPATSGHSIKSPDPACNCIAFALGDLENFWYDAGMSGYHWPPDFPSADTMEGWVRVFAVHGYEDASDGSFEQEFEKSRSMEPMRRLSTLLVKGKNGAWVSKMGRGHDIEHPTLHAIQGDIIGSVVKIMKRRCGHEGRRVLE